MTVTLVGSPTTTTGGASTTLVVNLPASPTVGNTLVMILGFFSTAPTNPTGWLPEHVTLNSTTSMRLAAYSRIVDGSEGSTITVSGYVTDDSRTAMVVQATGAVSVDAVNSQWMATPFSCPDITTTMANDLVLVSAFSQTQGTSQFDDFPAGTTTLSKIKSSVVSGWAATHSLGSRAQAVAGATGTT